MDAVARVHAGKYVFGGTAVDQVYISFYVRDGYLRGVWNLDDARNGDVFG